MDTELTAFELRILKELADGKDLLQITSDFNKCCYDTMKTHKRKLFHKLGVHSAAHAVAEGFRRKLLT